MELARAGYPEAKGSMSSAAMLTGWIRRNCTFCGSDRGGERPAAICMLIATAKLNDVDPEA